jgi:DNA polymerase delta subunit 2
MNSPSVVRVAPPVSIKRASRFLLKNAAFDRQFFHLYHSRLDALCPIALETARRTWGSSVLYADKLLSLPENSSSGELYAVAACLIKTVAKRYSAIQELGGLHPVEVTRLPFGRLASEDDILTIEDPSSSMPLELASADAVSVEPVELDPGKLCTGLVLAFLGTVADGVFVAQRVCFPLPAPQAPFPLPCPDASVPRPLTLFVAGLELGRPESSPLRSRLLADWLAGALAHSQEEAAVPARVNHVVVAGCSVSAPESSAEGKQALANPYAKYRGVTEQLHAPVRAADALLSRLAASVPVLDLMPGYTDPVPFALPQPPMHPVLFPATAAASSFCPVTNPYRYAATQADGGLAPVVHVCDGRVVRDIMSVTTIDSPLDVLELMLRARHLAPTAPESVDCHALTDDLFVISSSPHILIAGACSKFESRVVDFEGGRSLLVALPGFWHSGTAVLVDEAALTASPLTIELPYPALPGSLAEVAAGERGELADLVRGEEVEIVLEEADEDNME